MNEKDKDKALEEAEIFFKSIMEWNNRKVPQSGAKQVIQIVNKVWEVIDFSRTWLNKWCNNNERK